MVTCPNLALGLLGWILFGQPGRRILTSWATGVGGGSPPPPPPIPEMPILAVYQKLMNTLMSKFELQGVCHGHYAIDIRSPKANQQRKKFQSHQIENQIIHFNNMDPTTYKSVKIIMGGRQKSIIARI